MKIFYARVSTEHQNEERQIKMANEQGIEKIYIEKVSGKDRNRPKLKEMLNFVREGDVVYTESISRIARNTKDLLSIIDELNAKNVGFISLKENIDTATATGKFMLTVFAALAELERENILERQREGIEIAKQQGKYKGRKPQVIDENRFKTLCEEWREGKRTAVSIQRDFNITGNTFYNWVKIRQL